MFEIVEYGPPDPMYELKIKADNDASPEKVDLGVGIYRNEEGLYSELHCIREAKKKLAKIDPGHDYEMTTGNPRFLKHAARVIFGVDSDELRANKIASVQTISGTGAIHMAAQLIAKSIRPAPALYVGTPAWGNYKPLFELSGLEVVEYQYYDSQRRVIDFDLILMAARTAPLRSIFVLQGCCHNPTGADLTPEQWYELILVLKDREHVPLLDVAYQGLGNGLEEDAYSVRLFAKMGFEAFVCQSFSKNFALYGERCGALHVVCKDEETSQRVFDRLRCLIRWDYSSSPAFGCRLVNIVLGSEELVRDWKNQLKSMRSRLKGLRRQLYDLLTCKLRSPGNWDNIIRETGLFSYLPLAPSQCQTLRKQYHIYLPDSGRITVSGLNQNSIVRVASAIDKVVRSSQSNGSAIRDM